MTDWLRQVFFEVLWWNQQLISKLYSYLGTFEEQRMCWNEHVCCERSHLRIHVMTAEFPLDGPCTQLLMSSVVCSKWLLTRKWKTSADQRKTDLQDSLLIVPGKSAFTVSFMHRMDQRLYLLGNCTITSWCKQICFPHCTRPENIISVISSGWDKSQVLLAASLAKQQQWLTEYNMFPSDGEVDAHQTVGSIDAWRCDHLTKCQPQTGERCAGEVTNSLKWRQRLIVGCDLSLTASCWTHIPVAAMMDFLPKASRRPLWVERPPVGIFLTSQGSFCSCYDEIHPHMSTRGHLVSEDVSALRKELDQQAPVGTELGNKWTFHFKEQNVNFGSPNSVFSVFSHLT